MRKSFLLQHLREAGARRIFTMRFAVWAVLAMAFSPLAAQNTPRPEDLTLENVVPPTASTNRLSVQFMLPLPDTVSSFEVSAGGMPIDKDKLNFTPTAKIQDFRCAVLLLIDNALGNNPDLNKSAHEKQPDVQESVRGALRRLIPAAANSPFEFGIATYSATNMVVLAAIKGNNTSVLDQAVLPKYLKFDGGDPELLYHGAKEALVKSLGTIQADRKFLVIISDGVSKDTADSEADVVKAAHDAKVHICLDADSTRHPITKTAVRIGRKQDNDLVMKNDSVSSHHAEILKRGDKFIIADLGAANGVFVMGKRVEKIALENGDIIELGEVRLRFTLNQSDE